MRKLVVACLLLFMASGVLADDSQKKEDTKSAKEKFEAIQKDRNDAMRAFSLAYSKAKTQEAKNKVFSELFPAPTKYAAQYLQVAKDHPDDPVAAKALIEVVTATRSGDLFNEALAILSKHHVESLAAGQVCQRLVYSPSAATEKFIRLVLEKSSHRGAKGLACFSLARYRKRLVQMVEYIANQQGATNSYEQAYGKEFVAGLKKVKPDEIQKEAEALFERVAKEFADIPSYRGTLGDAAGHELFEIRNLAIGKVAPDIEGRDLDGVGFKLSDYRGKVVVIDFWGDW